MDYSLFYVNIKENVKQRIESYFKQGAVGFANGKIS